jgi:hypothetical protein
MNCRCSCYFCRLRLVDFLSYRPLTVFDQPVAKWRPVWQSTFNYTTQNTSKCLLLLVLHREADMPCHYMIATLLCALPTHASPQPSTVTSNSPLYVNLLSMFTKLYPSLVLLLLSTFVLATPPVTPNKYILERQSSSCEAISAKLAPGASTAAPSSGSAKRTTQLFARQASTATTSSPSRRSIWNLLKRARVGISIT